MTADIILSGIILPEILIQHLRLAQPQPWQV